MTPDVTPGPAPAPKRSRGRPAGVRAGTAETRERILAAARTEFADRGYDKTSMRSIAKAAGVDPALVHHYFGTKEQTFGAAVELTFAPAFAGPDAVFGAPEGIGERVARFMLGIWESTPTREPILAVLRSAFTNESAAEVFRSMLTRRILARVAGELDVPEPELRVQLAAAQLLGVAVLRHVLKVEPIASADFDDVVAMIAPTLQGYLTAGGA
ncbi:TetR family transcriptional regulator [Actinacidiphila oryziradicis]|uniref:TetR/AcrR family transcriptional regulator n=1 Tax=Actinacidiphila oryziradicis TaxID=2571141 RepID=UPI0023F24A57|nr:TetR family transcriptional regulator [Actinacidiphila oryziradicis]MCW2874782.1 regulatory protein TetR [Actinacidiphila oryziradicis]